MALMFSRVPKNKTEAAFIEAAGRAGYAVYKRGWPDFLITNGNRICAVEVKPHNHGLRGPQITVMKLLTSRGVPCFVWTPTTGFDPFEVGIHKSTGPTTTIYHSSKMSKDKSSSNRACGKVEKKPRSNAWWNMK